MAAQQPSGDDRRASRSVYLCEHLWTRWDVTEGYILGAPPPSDDHFFFTRHCELCGLDDACYGLHYPETPKDLDVTWMSPF